MTKDKEMKAVFIMMQEMKTKISKLEDQIKYLSENKQNSPGCCKHCKAIEEVQEEIENHITFNANEIANVNSELDQVNKSIEEWSHRTDELEENQMSQIKFNIMLQNKVAIQVDKLLELEVRVRKPQMQAQTFSVTRQKPPEFARSSQSQRSRPIQVRWNRAPQIKKVRLCYNCRKEGHLAKVCNKPNPRLNGLSDQPQPKLKLSDQLKRKT